MNDAAQTRRLEGQTFDVVLGAHDGPPPHPGFHVSLSLYRHPVTRQPHEVVFNERGKIGSDTDRIFSDLGIAMSRLLQERDQNTGEPL